MSGARDVVLTGSLALAALGSSFAFIGSTLADLKSAQVMTILCVGLAVVLIPVVIIAAIKLHRRNLSGILEASGWAINARMRLSTRLARRLAPAPVHPGSFTKLRKDLLKV
jgi:Flp pilus assembly pilin Flp